MGRRQAGNGKLATASAGTTGPPRAGVKRDIDGDDMATCDLVHGAWVQGWTVMKLPVGDEVMVDWPAELAALLSKLP